MRGTGSRRPGRALAVLDDRESAPPRRETHRLGRLRVEAIVGPFGCTADTLAAASVDTAVPFVSDELASTLGGGAVLRTDTGRLLPC